MSQKYVTLKTTPEAKRIIKVEAAKLGCEMGVMGEALASVAVRHPEYNRLIRVAIKRINDREAV